jgi:hypothetical protein
MPGKQFNYLLNQDYTKALSFAEMLHSDNIDRREADSNITEEALALIEKDLEHGGRKTTVVYQEHWHKGVVGIVASSLIETITGQPSCLPEVVNILREVQEAWPALICTKLFMHAGITCWVMAVILQQPV